MAEATTSMYQYFTREKKCEKRKSSSTAEVENSVKLFKKKATDQDADSKLTALEKQFIKLKEENPDVILLIETGYLFRLFREDAEIAKQELGFKCSAGHNLVTTSFPRQLLPIHIRHLARKGYKVGVVRKTESGLMKANGSEPNEIFKREITALYTSSTLVGEDVDFMSCDADEFNAKNHYRESVAYLMSLYELQVSAEKMRIGVVAVCLLSGEFVYDHFFDDENRNQVQNVFQLIDPVEILVPNLNLSDTTYNFINARKKMSAGSSCPLRIVQMEDHNFLLANVVKYFSDYFIQMECHEYIENLDDLVNFIMQLPPPVICALRALMTYLKEFKLEYIFTLIKQMKLISSKIDNVPFDLNTIRSLELVQCNRTLTFEGSLYHVLDQTVTPFGSRLLKSWICNPLKSQSQIEERLNAVDFLLNSNLEIFCSLKKLMNKMPDLESGIAVIYNKRSSPKLYWRTLTAFLRIKIFVKSMESEIESTITDAYLQKLLLAILLSTEGIEILLSNLRSTEASKGSKLNLFKDCTSYSNLFSAAAEIQELTTELDKELPQIAKTLNDPNVKHGNHYDKKYVIKVPQSLEHLVPEEWLIVCRTESNIYCRTSEIEQLTRRLKLLEEHYKYLSHLAWMEFLDIFKPFYFKLRNVVANLAIIDCLLSFAQVSKSHNFTKPVISNSAEERFIQIQNGYHPMVKQMLEAGKDFVSNDTNLSSKKESCMIINGANMGGKSVYIRQVAIITLIAQMGCFVPAESASLTPVDAIYVRCGTKDNITQGRSAFFVEVEEMSRVLRLATNRSLVLIDDFGRCTSDSDGSNLAFGVYNYIISKLQCLTLIVNSQFSDFAQLQEMYPTHVACYQMAVLAPSLDDLPDKSIEDHKIVYLYRLHPGVADKSYAMFVGKMAGIDAAILNRGQKKAKEIEENRQNLRSAVKLFRKLFLL